MNDKELYQQKKQAQLDEWKADFDRFKAKASGASADAQLKMNEHIKILEGKIDHGKTTLEKIGQASAEALESAKDTVESAWQSLKSAFSDANAKFRN